MTWGHDHFNGHVEERDDLEVLELVCRSCAAALPRPSGRRSAASLPSVDRVVLEEVRLALAALNRDLRLHRFLDEDRPSGTSFVAARAPWAGRATRSAPPAPIDADFTQLCATDSITWMSSAPGERIEPGPGLEAVGISGPASSCLLSRIVAVHFVEALLTTWDPSPAGLDRSPSHRCTSRGPVQLLEQNCASRPCSWPAEPSVGPRHLRSSFRSWPPNSV